MNRILWNCTHLYVIEPFISLQESILTHPQLFRAHTHTHTEWIRAILNKLMQICGTTTCVCVCVCSPAAGRAEIRENKTNYVQFDSPLSKRLIAWKYVSVTGEYFNLSTPATSTVFTFYWGYTGRTCKFSTV